MIESGSPRVTDCVTIEFFFVWCFFCREAISAAPMVTGCQSRLREQPRGRRSKGEACDVDLPANSSNHQVRAPHTDHGRGETTVRPWWIRPRRWPRRQLSR
jgi:hypothetical protein